MAEALDTAHLTSTGAFGALPAFVSFLTNSTSPEMQFEAAWALTNVASTEYTRVVVEHGAACGHAPSASKWPVRPV